MLPDFAFNGNELLFEPLSEEVANSIASVIWDAINAWDDRVNLKHIHVNVNYDHNQYEITVTFEILNITKEPENLILVFKKE
jgi:phage baseplate assembly protein W